MGHNKKNQLLIVISSPSGAGKTSICQKLIEIDSSIRISISDTTRSARQNEVDGRDYNFISNAEFMKKIKKNEYIEFANVFGNYYGSAKTNIENILRKGYDVLFDIDWQGASQLKKSSFHNIVSIFIIPPTKDEIQKRLNLRATESGDNKESIKKRMELYETEMSHQNEYDYIVVNDKFSECIDEIANIIKQVRKKD